MSWDRLDDYALGVHIEAMTTRCITVLNMTSEEQNHRKTIDGCSNLQSAVLIAHLLAGALAEWDRRHPQ